MSDSSNSPSENPAAHDKVWFDNSSQINCSLDQVKKATEDMGEFFVGVVSLMPGMTSVELLEQGDGFVKIKTNEGIMLRNNISRTVEDNRLVLEFDEEYKAGRLIDARSHMVDEFTSEDSGVVHRTTISGVKAPGVLGFFYRNFASKNIGKAFLGSQKEYLEK